MVDLGELIDFLGCSLIVITAKVSWSWRRPQILIFDF